MKIARCGVSRSVWACGPFSYHVLVSIFSILVMFSRLVNIEKACHWPMCCGPVYLVSLVKNHCISAFARNGEIYASFSEFLFWTILFFSVGQKLSLWYYHLSDVMSNFCGKLFNISSRYLVCGQSYSKISLGLLHSFNTPRTCKQWIRQVVYLTY